MDGIIFVGNPPMQPSGYGKQLALLQKHLSGQYEMAHICDFGYKGPSFTLNGVKVYGVAEYPGVLTTKHIDKCIENFLSSKPIDRWLIIGLGNLYNRGILENYPSLLLSVVETEHLNDGELHAISTSIPIAISRFGQNVIQNHGIECGHVAPHAVDMDTIPKASSASLRAKKDWPFASTKLFVAGFFGDLSMRKNPYKVFQLWDRFSQGKSDVRLWVHHSNHTDCENKALVEFSQMHNTHITTTDEGWDDHEMMRKLKTLDCLLHPSSREGFGIFQAEAQCVGTPVIAYDEGPAKEVIVEPQLLSPSDDVEELLARLEFVYKSWSAKNFSLNDKIQKRALSIFKPEYAFSELNSALDLAFTQFYPEAKYSKQRRLKHVCIVSTWGIDCGIATYTKMLVDNMKGCKVTILAEGSVGKSERYGEVEVIYCWDRNFPSEGNLKGVIDAIQPDVVHLQHETSLMKYQEGLYESLYDIDAKIVATLHTPDFTNPHINTISSQADLVILHNEPLSRNINGSLPNAVQHIPHGSYAIPAAAYDRSQTGVPQGIPLIFNYGFCSPTKGVLELVRAVKMLKEGKLLDGEGNPITTTHFEVVIYAGKDNKEYFARCAKEASGLDGLILTDEILPEEGIDYWANVSDFIVFPYSPSSHPFQVNSTSGAVMRVLSAGKPIIATDEGRLRDIIGGVHGWKCAMGSIESLAYTIHKAVEQFNYNKRAYQEMSQNVLALHHANSWGKVAEKHVSTYRKICRLGHWRTKNPVFTPTKKSAEVQLLLDDVGEEE